MPYRLVFAIATEDSLLLYDTQHLTPFGFVSGIHYSNLTDLTWSNDGLILTVSSIDGFCTFVTFNEKELGEIYVPQEEAVETLTESTKKSKAENEDKPEKNKIINLFTNAAVKTKIVNDENKNNEVIDKKKIESEDAIAVVEVIPNSKTTTAEKDNKNSTKRRIKLVPMNT